MGKADPQKGKRKGDEEMGKENSKKKSKMDDKLIKSVVTRSGSVVKGNVPMAAKPNQLRKGMQLETS